jgi:hypothetical protein
LARRRAPRSTAVTAPHQLCAVSFRSDVDVGSRPKIGSGK